MSRSLVAVALIVPVVFGSCSFDDRGGIPRALHARAEHEDVTPFDGFQANGLALYRVSGSVPDNGWSYVVGIDESGRLVEREALMRSLGPLEARVFAERALGVLMGEEGARPLLPSGERRRFTTAEEWSVVTEPRRRGDAVVFFFMMGEMSPTLNEVTIDVTTYRISHRSAVDVLLSRGRTVSIGSATCRPFAECGCFLECRRFEPLRVPGSDEVHHRLLDDPGAGDLYVSGPACNAGECARTCRADSPTADCDPALVPVLPGSCADACAANEAPFRCETLVEGCRRVAHPIRMGLGRERSPDR